VVAGVWGNAREAEKREEIFELGSQFVVHERDACRLGTRLASGIP
jgi:hypothetical protein